MRILALPLFLLFIPVIAQDRDANLDLPARPIAAGDLLSVRVYGAPELTRSVRVSAEGRIRLPMLLHPLEAKGLMPAQLEDLVAEALIQDEVLVSPAVTVTIAEYHTKPISVAGAVRRPLTYPIFEKTTLLEAITRAEGLSADAGSEILVTRPAAPGAPPLVQRVAVKGLIDGADPALNLVLEGGEEVRVPQVGRVVVAGNVRKPGAFRIEDNTGMTVMKALALAEGLAPFATKQAYIYRRTDADPSVPAQEITVELRQLMDRKTKDPALGPNDILYIPDSRRARVTANAIEKAVSFAAGTASGALILGVNR
jgi:polysaccharide export outer membrane protein